LKNDSRPSASVTRFQLRGSASDERRPKESVRRTAPAALAARFWEEAADSDSAGGAAASASVVYRGPASPALLLRRLVKESERPSPAAAPAALVAEAAAADAAADAASRADAAAAAPRALAAAPPAGIPARAVSAQLQKPLQETASTFIRALKAAGSMYAHRSTGKSEGPLTSQSGMQELT